MRIYLASSWRNGLQPQVLEELRAAGHSVYDFRNPAPGNTGFGWKGIDEQWLGWTPEEFRAALDHPLAREGFRLDMDALRTCDACVLLLPCGRSAHLELGWAAGAGKITAALMLGPTEPELMYAMLGAVCTSVPELVAFLNLPCGGCLAGHPFKAETGADRYHVVERHTVHPPAPGFDRPSHEFTYTYERCAAPRERA